MAGEEKALRLQASSLPFDFLPCTKIIWALRNRLWTRIKCEWELLPTGEPKEGILVGISCPSIGPEPGLGQALKPASNYMLSTTFKKAIFLYISRT